MFNTNVVFRPGKMTVIMDGSAGSSGKGKIGAFIGENAGNWQFACHAFMSNAAHWVVTDDGDKYLYQALNSVAHLKDHYEKLYICGGAVLEIQPLLKEIERHNLNPDKLGIHPIVAIVQQKDVDYERGIANFDGDPLVEPTHSDCMKLGSTLHGVGAARARRILRRSDVLLARDVDQLSPFLCWTEREIMDRLDRGQAGLMEIAQGYQLSYLSQFFPRCTSRNCSVAAGLDDCGLPPYVAGDVVINFRTFPIRVNSNKYVHAETNEILTSSDMNNMRAVGQAHLIKTLKGDSGGCYPDQQEISWEEVTKRSGIQAINPNREIREQTSLTQLERRVYTFSKQNMVDAIRFNRADGCVWVTINFINYVDATLEGVRAVNRGREGLTKKALDWMETNTANLSPDQQQQIGDTGFRFLGLGTGAKTNDMMIIDDQVGGFTSTPCWGTTTT